MGQRVFSVGTTPVLLSNGIGKRTSIVISMSPTSVAAGNTGTVYIGKGFVPIATSGAPNSGTPILQGTQIQDVGSFPDDPSVFQGQWWAVADTASQQLQVDESYAARG